MISEEIFDRKLREQSEDLKEHTRLLTAPILEEVKRTNGRVTKNEGDIIAYKVWRGWMTGGMAMLMIFLPIIVSVLTYMLLEVAKFDQKIHAAIDKALAAEP